MKDNDIEKIKTQSILCVNQKYIKTLSSELKYETMTLHINPNNILDDKDDFLKSVAGNTYIGGATENLRCLEQIIRADFFSSYFLC